MFGSCVVLFSSVLAAAPAAAPELAAKPTVFLDWLLLAGAVLLIALAGFRDSQRTGP